MIGIRLPRKKFGQVLLTTKVFKPSTVLILLLITNTNFKNFRWKLAVVGINLDADTKADAGNYLGLASGSCSPGDFQWQSCRLLQVSPEKDIWANSFSSEEPGGYEIVLWDFIRAAVATGSQQPGWKLLRLWSRILTALKAICASPVRFSEFLSGGLAAPWCLVFSSSLVFSHWDELGSLNSRRKEKFIERQQIECLLVLKNRVICHHCWVIPKFSWTEVCWQSGASCS